MNKKHSSPMTYTTELVQVVNDVCVFVPGRHKAGEAIADTLPDQVYIHDRQMSANRWQYQSHSQSLSLRKASNSASMLLTSR